ncbi:LLM class flavin-dependent oxidoreductase [Belnapia mucosa]|nr:LLM class flavin-dependent oxidoreductase [Belnapia mucosa]
MVQPTGRPLKVGLVLPLEHDHGRTKARWRDIKALAQHAEAAGFDSLWLPDHLVYDFAQMGGIPDVPPWGVWEAWSILSSVAAVTERVEIGPLVSCTSFRNPALLAKMADTVDEISNGRLVLGLGAGYHEIEFRQFGYPLDHLVGRFDEALQIIHALLRTGKVDFEGAYYSTRECELLPRGPRRTGPPILMGAKAPRTRRLAAQYADYWNGLRVDAPEKVVPMREAMDDACIKAGRDPKSLLRTMLLLFDLPGAYGGEAPEGHRAFRTALGASPAGTAEALAEKLRAFAREGISHVQIWLEPNTRATVDAMVPVLELLDRA